MLILAAFLTSCATMAPASSDTAVIQQAQEIARSEALLEVQEERILQLFSQNQRMTSLIEEALIVGDDLRDWQRRMMSMTSAMSSEFAATREMLGDLWGINQQLIQQIADMIAILKENGLWEEI
jgi:propanediol dehydratase small subunit